MNRIDSANSGEHKRNMARSSVRNPCGGTKPLPANINAERFWKKVDRRGPDECWPWTGALNNRGYGTIGWGGESWLAHRVSYRLHKGEPGSLIIRHRCDNRPCCNPDHLLSGTHKDNSDDVSSRGLLKRNDGTTVQIPKKIAAYIRENPDRLSVGDFAKMYEISEWAVNTIQRGELWRIGTE